MISLLVNGLMGGPVGSLLAKHWKFVAMGIMALVIGFLWLRNDVLKADLRAAEARVEVVEEANEEFARNEAGYKRVINRQNDSIVELQAMTNAQEQQLDVALRQADLILARSNEQVLAILQSDVPGSCDGAMDWLLDQAIIRGGDLDGNQ